MTTRALIHSHDRALTDHMTLTSFRHARAPNATAASRRRRRLAGSGEEVGTGCRLGL